MEKPLNFNSFIEGSFDQTFFDDIDVIIHLTSIAHNFDIPTMEEMDRVSLHFTEKLLNSINLEKVKKIIYLSSIAVSLLENGTVLDTEQYGISKKKTEDLLIKFHSENSSAFQLTILRPLLIYRKNAPGNCLKLLNMLKKPVILPLGSFKNKRSFLSLENLISGINAVIEAHLINKSNVYEISDPWVCTLSSFMKDFKNVTNAKAIIIPFPLRVLITLLVLVGKSAMYDKLALELTVDFKKIQKDFNWLPSCKNQLDAFEKSL